MQNSVSPIAAPHPQLADPNRKADDPILLYRGPMKGHWTDTEAITTAFPAAPGEKQPSNFAQQLIDGVQGTGEVTLALSPAPHVSWLFLAMIWPPMQGWPVLVPPGALTTEFATRAGPGGPPELPESRHESAGRSRVFFPVQVGDPNGRLDEIRFYLVNFQVLQLIDNVNRGERSDPLARMDLRADGWRVEIESLPNEEFGQVVHHLEEQRGYAITHTCRIWREGGKAAQNPFTFAEAESILEAVQLFFSFVRGGMVAVALPVGYRNGTSEFEQWSVTTVDPGRYPDPHRSRPYPGWDLWYDHPPFNRKAAAWLPPMFEQFAAKWWHPDSQFQKLWRKVFRELILTYTDAERMEQSTAIVPACTALETLGWAVLVKMEQWITEDRPPGGGRSEYESLTAADRLRLLLRWAGLSTEIPTSLSRIRQEAQGRDNWDGPQIATWARNRVVHPDRRDRLVDGIAAEAWLLAMWYAELTILKLLDYDGWFRDRLDNEKIKRVPWADESSVPE